MKIYIDLIFFMNLFYDYVLLLFLGLILKRRIVKWRLGISSLIGSLSVFLMVLNINDYSLLFIKIFISLLMLIIAFGFISLKYTFNNLLYLYMLSIILAGFLYYLNIHFSHSNQLLLVIIGPIVLIYEYYCHKKSDYQYNYYYKLEIYFSKQKITCMAYLDSGNNLIDYISGKPIIILNKKYLKNIKIRSPVYVPYDTLNAHGLMKCYKPSYIMINKRKIKNYLIGETDIHFKDGIGALLNNHLRKDNYV